MTYHICLIEDHETLWKLTQQELQSSWYACERYTSWNSDINIEQFDCFVLDVMLPWIDGFTIWKNIRAVSDVWIIYLTAKIQLEDKIRWFKTWADDYLTKPFLMKELTLRIAALLQRVPKSTILLSTWVTIDITKRIITNQTQTIHCTPIERHVLTELVQNHWKPCSRVSLIEAGWWEDSLFSMSRSLDVTIANLRSKLWKSVISTIPKIWYQLI